MYYVVCDSCSVEERAPDLASAQELFNRHVDDRHEVVLERIESPREGSGPTGDGASPAPGPGDGETETAGGHPTD